MGTESKGENKATAVEACVRDWRLVASSLEARRTRALRTTCAAFSWQHSPCETTIAIHCDLPRERQGWSPNPQIGAAQQRRAMEFVVCQPLGAGEASACVSSWAKARTQADGVGDILSSVDK
eukprot:2819951-Pleurochrysis_carterae.AAC.1